ncbi:MAG: hypothetical protein ACR2RE_21530, partial [Geminicoccaceae bacterium]
MTIAFTGYAVTSADGFIADREGRMPEALRFDADWAYFQAALDAADITLLGRRTHEAAPNVKERRRLVVSRAVRAVVRENAFTWRANPEDVAPASAVAETGGSDAEVAVVGGTGVFDWILAEGGYHAFHLSLARGVWLGDGRPLFDGIADFEEALSKLGAEGLLVETRSWLDRKAGLELLI